MKRDTDFQAVRDEHLAIHERLVNWARWSRSYGRGHDSLPMFRGYRPYLYPETYGGGEPIDSLDAIAVQKSFAHIPEKQRWAIHWFYCYPFINPHKVCRTLAVSRDGLADLVHTGRTMVKNRLTAREEVC